MERTAISGLLRRDFVYSLVLFLLGVAALAACLFGREATLAPSPPSYFLFFLLYGLFTIAMGYEHPRIGYVSFDRVAQVASILVLGPVDAAWVAGLASLLFPLTRLARGVPLISVLTAALHNSGLMALMVLVCGSLYLRIGGPAPLGWIDAGSLLPLALLLFSMQAFNDFGMRVMISIRDRSLLKEVSFFAFLVESSAGLGGILMAIVINRMELQTIVLLIAVMSLGMFALTQFARLRMQLEALVDERTRKLSEKSRELQRLATHDPLTGLLNRRYADDYLDERIEEFKRYQRGFSIALIDLDHFKRINDDFSHDTGDEVLRLISALFSDRCRDSDMVARYGGEEFILCFPGTDMATARELCEELRVSVEEMDWAMIAPGAIVTLSAGVAGIRPGMSRRALLSEADVRLYEAKFAGRNQIVPRSLARRQH
ncbi:MAG: GGDEF domain-containing protein [Gammaproteobacteria bacterium]